MNARPPNNPKFQNHTMSSPSSPLLPKDGSSAPKPLSRTAARAAGLARVLFGAACILAPTLTMRLFGIDLSPGAAFLVSFSGIRDAVLGELLLVSDGQRAKSAGGTAREAVRTILWGIAAVDALDVCVLGMAVAKGELGWKGFAWIAGLAAGSVALVGEALWGY